MPIQYPGTNTIPKSAIDMYQTTQNNALVNQGQKLLNDANSFTNKNNQTLWDDDRKQKGQKVLFEMASKTSEFIKQRDGDAVGVWAKVLPDWQRNLQDLGLPIDNLPGPDASPEEIMEGLNNILNSADLGGGKEPTTYGTPVRGESTYLRPTNDGGMYDTGAAAPQGTGAESRQQWEYGQVVNDARAAGQEPPDYMTWLKDDPRRQSSADMQAYNSYLGSYRGDGSPMSEQEYAATRAGNIAGKKTEGSGLAQRQLDLPSAYSLHSQTSQNFTRLTDAATKLGNNAAMWKAVGLYKSLSAVPGQEGADIRASIQNIKSQVGFMVLQDMRNASKTGGALGQVSEKENELLQDNLASLDVNQSPQQFQENLKIVIDYLDQAQSRLDRAWELTYPELTTYGDEKMPEIDTGLSQQVIDEFQVRWDAAKTGDVLIDPNGKSRQKQ